MFLATPPSVFGAAKSPAATIHPLCTAIAETLALPSGADQEERSHVARLLAGVVPAVSNVPPTTSALLYTVMQLAAAPLGRFSPSARGDHWTPSQAAMLLTDTPPAALK